MLKDMYSAAIKLINNLSTNDESAELYPITAMNKIHQFLASSLTCIYRIEDGTPPVLRSVSQKLDPAFEEILKAFIEKSKNIREVRTFHVSESLKIPFTKCLILPFVYSETENCLLISFDYALKEIETSKGFKVLDSLKDSCTMMMKHKLLIKKQEETIQALEEREKTAHRHQMYFKQLFDNMNSGVAIYTPIEDEDGINFIFKDYNKAGERLDGMKKADLLGKKVTDIFPGVVEFGLFDVLKSVTQTGKSQQHPISLYNSGSLKSWRENDVFKLPDGSIVAIYNDLTQQKRAEDDVRKYSRYAKALIENSPHPMLIFNSKKAIEYVNPAFQSLTGFSQEECVGMSSNFPWIQQEKDTSSIVFPEDFHNGKKIHIETRFINKKGIPFWVEMYNMPIRLRSDLILHISYWVDITERKYVEENLRAREEENKKILNAVVSGLYIYDFEKQYNEYINPSYTAITGWTLDDIHAMGKNFHGLFHQEDLNKFNRHMDRIQNSKTDYFRTMEYRFQTKNDGWKWLLTYDVPFERDIDGKVKKVLGTFIDVSERKKIEKALLESERKAQEANRAKSEFIANMSHEIRTPLNGVIGFTDLMMTTTLNKDQQQYIQNIQSASIVLMDLINDILDFSKIEAGKLELENEEFNLLEMLERTVEVIKIKAQEKNIELLFDYSPEAPVRVYGDAVRLRQIILNFLSNAVKFTEKGEIELSVKISNRNEDDKLIRLRFSVRDTGIGIPENKKSDILQQFSQADNSITRKYGGTGLGLSIAKKIIDKMGSEMNIETHPGMGSCFSFEVDLHYSDTMECRSQKIPFSSVLIVDDNRKNLEILEKIFKHWHIKVELSHNGFEALQKLETMMNTIDLIIMDYAMPYMNGIETIKKMKSELKMTADNKPMIILYSSIDSGIAEEDTVDGFIDRKLVKPATMNTLLKVLCNHNENINQKQKHEKSGALSGTILIAEDNTLNRELIKKYLKKIGVFSVFEAENGKKAIDLYVKNKESIDLILMDIQMPEIDGYRAAHEIRSIEGQNSNLKIIALTARSIKGEEEKAKEAGMNEFISKPIRLDTLRALLRRTLPKTSVSLKNWIEKYLTTMELSPSEIEEIISEYAHSLKNSIKKLQDAILSEDFDTIEKISHMIKGTSANVGGQPLVDLFTQMNNMLKNGDHNSIKIQMILEKVIPISNLLQEEII